MIFSGSRGFPGGLRILVSAVLSAGALRNGRLLAFIRLVLFDKGLLLVNQLEEDLFQEDLEDENLSTEDAEDEPELEEPQQAGA